MSNENKHMEEYIFELINPILVKCLEKENLSDTNISFRFGPEEKDGYSSIYIKSYLLMRIRYRKKTKYLAVTNDYFEKSKALLSSEVNTTNPKSLPGFTRIEIIDPEQVVEMKDFIAACTAQLLNDMPTQFDCCSRYKECSDKMQCVNPNQQLAFECSYRKKLSKGVSFYGKK